MHSMNDLFTRKVETLGMAHFREVQIDSVEAE
jgi:hypothetical protein